jgi:hypothetical protein
MQDEIELIIARGHQAADLLRNTTFNDVVKELKLSNYEAWLSSETAEQREELYLRTAALDDIVEVLMGRVSAGQYQQSLLNDQNEERYNDDD